MLAPTIAAMSDPPNPVALMACHASSVAPETAMISQRSSMLVILCSDLRYEEQRPGATAHELQHLPVEGLMRQRCSVKPPRFPSNGSRHTDATKRAPRTAT